MLLCSKVFARDQISTPPEPLCLKDLAEQMHLPYSCEEGPDGCFQTSQLVLFVHASTSIFASSCFLASLGGEISFQL